MRNEIILSLIPNININIYFNSNKDCLTYGKYCNGEDNINKKYFQDSNVSSSDKCSRACMENHKCKFWHYYVGQFIGQGNECRLFTACNDIREDPDNLMGNKHCPGGNYKSLCHSYHDS